MRKTKAKGYRETHNGKLKIACAFDTLLFLRIRALAVKERKSFARMVEELCKVGILDLEDSDRLEPRRPHEEHPQ